MNKKLVIALAGAAAALTMSTNANAAVLYNYAGALSAGIVIDNGADILTVGTSSVTNTSDFAPGLTTALTSSPITATTEPLSKIFSTGCIASVTCVVDVKSSSGNDYVLLTDSKGKVVATDIGSKGYNLGEKIALGADLLAGDVLYANVLPTGAGEPSTSPVPEPTTWALMLVGFGMMGFAMRKRARQNAQALAA